MRIYLLFLSPQLQATVPKNLSPRGGLVSNETVFLSRWGVQTNVWFINRVDR